jgi:hypothetical protein
MLHALGTSTPTILPPIISLAIPNAKTFTFIILALLFPNTIEPKYTAHEPHIHTKKNWAALQK